LSNNQIEAKLNIVPHYSILVWCETLYAMGQFCWTLTVGAFSWDIFNSV